MQVKVPHVTRRNGHTLIVEVETRSVPKLYELDGRKVTAHDIARVTGYSSKTVMKKLAAGWDVAAIIRAAAARTGVR